MASPNMAKCTVCSNQFQDPRMLKCLHTFCLQCIKKESERQGAKEELKCPFRACGEKVAIPKGGIEALPLDQRKAHEAEKFRYGEKLQSGKEQCDVCVRKEGPAVAFCVNCCEFLCGLCETHHRSARKTQKHEVVTVSEEKKENESYDLDKAFSDPPVPCITHSDEVLKFYCEACDELICRDCMELSHNEHRSKCDRVEAVATRAMESLQSCAKDSPGAVDAVKAAIALCKKAMARIDSRKNEVDEMIQKSLNNVREALLTQNEEMWMGKTAKLKMQVEALKKVGDDLTYALSLIESAKSYTPAQQLSTKRVLAERVEELMKRYNFSERIPLESAHFLTKIADEDVIRQMIDLGQITGGSHAQSCTCDAGFVPRAVVGKERTIKVTARGASGQPFSYGKETVTAQLSHLESNELSMHCQTTDHGDGTYSLAFTAQSAGLYEFQVKISGHEIQGSPFYFTAREPQPTPYDALTSKVGFGTYTNAWDVAFTENGTMAVAERGYHTVSLFSVDGTRLHTFGKCGSGGSGNDYFNCPSGIAIIGNEMYVAENGNHRVQKINISSRRHEVNFGSIGKGNDQFSDPRGICIHPEGKLFIADYSNNRVQVLNLDGSFVHSITGDPQNEGSKFQHPWGVAFDPQGYLHIAAYSSQCIKVYTPEGQYVKSYGENVINSPTGIAVDEEGYVAVSNCRDRLWIYNPDHTHIVNTIQNLSGPVGIACDTKGVFWIAQSVNSRVLTLH